MLKMMSELKTVVKVYHKTHKATPQVAPPPMVTQFASGVVPPPPPMPGLALAPPADPNDAIAECLKDEQQLKNTIYAACQYVKAFFFVLRLFFFLY